MQPSVMLASDDNNPQFAGAVNPDDLLAVEFYDHKAVDDWATREQFEKTGNRTQVLKRECPFIRISVPSDNTNIIERPANGNDVNRWPRQWLNYQMQTGKIANAGDVPGWQIDEWDDLTDDQKRNLKFMRFATVEQIAGASDTQLQAMGMGAEGLRIRARNALHARNRKEINEVVAARDQEMADLKAQLAAQAEQMQQLLAMVQAPKTIPGHLTDARPDDAHSDEELTMKETPRRGPGRPPKEAAV